MAFVYVAPRSHTPGRCAPPGAKLVPALVPCYFLLFRGVIRLVFGTRTGPPTNCISSVPPPQAGAGGVSSSRSALRGVSPSFPSLWGVGQHHRIPQERPSHPLRPTSLVHQARRGPVRVPPVAAHRDTGANDGKTRGATGQSARHHPARTRRISTHNCRCLALGCCLCQSLHRFKVAAVDIVAAICVIYDVILPPKHATLPWQ
jgi:hypothetical protein